MANKYTQLLKKFNILAIREMLINSSLRLHLSPGRTVSAGEDVGSWTLHTAARSVNWSGHGRKVPKSKHTSAIRSSYVTPGYISEGMHVTWSQRALHLHVYCWLLQSKGMQPAWMSTNRRMDKEDVVYVHDGIFHSSVSTDEIVPFAGKGVETRLSKTSTMFSLI